MKHHKYGSLLVIAWLGSCSGLATPVSTVTPAPSLIAKSSPTHTPEHTFASASDIKSDLSHYGLIAYTVDIDGNEDIFTMHADGSNQTNITQNPSRDIEPAWSPDGKRIAFVSTRTGNPHIFSMNPDGSNVIQLTDDPGFGYFFAWSPDGQKMAYVTYSNDPDVHTATLIVMDADGDNKTVLTDELFSEYEVLGWSPDSQYLVYTIPEGYEGQGFYMVSTDGANQFKWTDLHYMDHIHWLDNENYIVYSRFSQDKGQPFILKIGADGSLTDFHVSNVNIASVFDTAYVTEDRNGLNWFTFEGDLISSFLFNQECEENPWATNFSLSLDKELAFVTASCQHKSSFFLVNDDGTSAHQVGNLIYDGLQITNASWSPDGKYVAKVIQYFIGYTLKQDIYLFDVNKTLSDPSTQPTQLTMDQATKNWGPIWQPIFR